MKSGKVPYSDNRRVIIFVAYILVTARCNAIPAILSNQINLPIDEDLMVSNDVQKECLRVLKVVRKRTSLTFYFDIFISKWKIETFSCCFPFRSHCRHNKLKNSVKWYTQLLCFLYVSVSQKAFNAWIHQKTIIMRRIVKYGENMVMPH